MAIFEPSYLSLPVEVQPDWWIHVCICGRCGQRWIHDGREAPLRCIRRSCRSEYWNKPVQKAAVQAAQLKRWKKARRTG